MSWSSRMIDTLHELKLAGLAFDAAWQQALSLHPPSERDQGYRDTLFVLDGDPDERSTVEWLQMVAADAWHGRRPVLRFLEAALELVEDTDDASGSARVVHAPVSPTRTKYVA